MTVTENDRPTVPESEAPTPEPDEERRAAKRAEADQQAADGGEALSAFAGPDVDFHGPTVPGTDLALVPPWREMQGMAAMAVTLSGANALPVALRNRPNDVFMVLLTARDCGVSLTTALREFHVIDGKVTLSPKVKLAMLNERGKREGWKVWPDPANNEDRATWHATREDRPGVEFSSTFTKAEATVAGLTGKDNWKKYPKRMMSWRALGYLLDDVFPEVATGLYDPDSVGAVTDEDGVPVIDVRSTEALPGMRSPANHGSGGDSDAPVPADEEDKAELRRRIGALPEGGQQAVREAVTATRDREGVEPLWDLAKLIARQLPRWRAIVDAVERRAKAGEWGDWEPPADPNTGEVPNGPSTPEEPPGSPPETPDATTPPAGDEEPSATDTPPPAPEPPTGVVEPSGDQPDGDADPREAMLDEVIALVREMPASKVLAELVRRAIEPPTSADRDEQRAERQRVLAERLFRERTGEVAAP